MNWTHWKKDESGCKLLPLLPMNEKGVHPVEEVKVKEGDEVTGILSLFRLQSLPVEREPNPYDMKKQHHILQRLQTHRVCWLREQMD
jgi:hypothetical protein